MKKVYKYKENRNLIIGEIYDFWIIKEIKLPDGIKYYVLKDPLGEKHLLQAKFYKQYNIKVGDYYSCKVDKVNCQGRLFIEPVHPFYRVGNEYLFRYLKHAFLIDKKGILTEYYLMKGENGELAFLIIEPNSKPLKGLFKNYKVVKIKKARVYIQKP